jgi:hypothetical protein
MCVPKFEAAFAVWEFEVWELEVWEHDFENIESDERINNKGILDEPP